MSTAPASLTLEALAARVEAMDRREQEHARKVADLEAANTALREEVAHQLGRMASYEAEIARLQAERTVEPEWVEQPEMILPPSLRRGEERAASPAALAQ